MNLRHPEDHEVYSYLRTLEGEARAKSAPGGAGGGYSYGGGPIFSDAFGTRRAPTAVQLVEAFKGVCYSCADHNANGVARTPLKLYATTARGESRPKCHTRGLTAKQKGIARLRLHKSGVNARGDLEEVESHPLLDMLADANPDFDAFALLRYTVLCMDVVGTGYWLPESGKLADVPEAVWPLQSQYVLPTRRADSPLVKEYTYYGESYEPERLIRIRQVGVKDPHGDGYSPTRAVFAYLQLGDSYESVQLNLMNSGMRPVGIASSKDPDNPMGDTERRRLDVELNTGYAAARSGKWWVVDSALDIHPLTFPPSDMAALAIEDKAFQRACNAFGVPIAYFSTETNLANLQAAEKQHAQNGIDPRCCAIAAALNKWTRQVARSSRNPRVKTWERLVWAFDDPVNADRELDAKLIDMDLKSGRRTINEVRADDGLEPVDWGDEPWLPQTLVQPSTAEEQRQQQADMAERQQALAEKPPKPEEAAKPGEKPPAGKPPKPNAPAKSLDRLARDVLTKINREIDGRRRGGAGLPPTEGPERGPTAGAPEHVWLADGQADPAGIDPLAPGATAAGAGGDTEGHGGPA